MPEFRPLRIFLCHAKEDKPTVRELYRRLSAEGWMDVWLDEEKLFPGQNWDIEIEKAVEDADAVIVCLSSNSVTKEGYVQAELSFVLDIARTKPEETIFVIPLRMDDCNVPRRLRSWQYVDYFPKNRRSRAYQRLLESLKLRVAKLGISIRDRASETPVNSTDAKYIENEKKHKAKEEDKRGAAQKPSQKIVSRLLTYIMLLVLISLVIGFAAKPLIDILLKVIPNSTRNPPGTITSIPSPSLITSTISTVTPPSALGIGSTMIGEDGATLVYVPEGEFKMGSTDADSLAESDEKPQHSVTLDAFWIDQTEVTNKLYAACVSAGACTSPSTNKSYTRSSYYGNSEFDYYPVIYVSWNDAKTYCEWAGRRLPTEAEWEKAARGADGRIYPWGDDAPNKDLLNYSQNVGDTTKVGSYETGKNFYGAYDMAGNVWEWVNDWYSDTYYQSSPSSNPLGPDSGQYRVLRGGSWGYNNVNVRSAYRNWHVPADPSSDDGFRCAQSAQ